ncbi:MAG: SH3 domain-containing protein [Eubacterium sp.]|nr:SH3 domain-containing protein [Eubacterium sp.]
MVQKNRNTASGKRRFLLRMATAVSVMSVLWCSSFVSMADAEGTVKVASAKIRQSADPNSTVVGSTSQGKTVTIKSQATDASGTSWYEVYIEGGSTGYIRADLVDKTGDGEIPQSSGGAGTQSDAAQTDSDAGNNASGAGVAAENAMDAQYATVSVNSKVRSAPSTNDTVVQSITEGTQVVVSGQSTGSSDGKVWYYVTFTGTDGGEKTGYIRSDLLSLGDMVPMPEETPVVEPEVPAEPEVPVHNDYELVYKDAEGAWYLIDNTTGGEYSDEYQLSQLLNAGQSQSDEAAEDAKTLVKQRIAIVALIVLAVILIIVVIIMAVKLRDAYYEDYEDEEEEEEDEEEEEVPVKRRRRDEEEEVPARRRGRDEEEEEAPVRRRRREVEEEADAGRRRRTGEEENTPKRRRQVEEEAPKPVASASAKRKAKNFLLDDDEFEFEFLTMDDKK